MMFYVKLGHQLRLIDSDLIPSSIIYPVCYPGEENDIIQTFISKYLSLIKDLTDILDVFGYFLPSDSKELKVVLSNLKNELKYVRLKKILRYAPRDAQDFVSCYNHSSFVFDSKLTKLAKFIALTLHNGQSSN